MNCILQRKVCQKTEIYLVLSGLRNMPRNIGLTRPISGQESNVVIEYLKNPPKSISILFVLLVLKEIMLEIFSFWTILSGLWLKFKAWQVDPAWLSAVYPQGPPLQCAGKGRFRGLAIQNFLDMVGFYMLVRAYPEVFGHQWPQNWAHWSRETALFNSRQTWGIQGYP